MRDIIKAFLGESDATWESPVPVDEVAFRSRATSKSDGGLTVTVAIPDSHESELLFGTSLYGEGIQPVWIEVVNLEDKSYFLLKTGVDQNQFSPFEASYQRRPGDEETASAMDRFFYEKAFANPINPGDSVSGFVYTNVDEGHKAINVDLLSNLDMRTFSFVVKVPGLVADIDRVNPEDFYDYWLDIEEEDELRSVLESLPSCTVNKEGTESGDPLNVVMIGQPYDIFSALIRSEWHQTEILTGDSIAKTVKSFVLNSEYRHSPISPLYVFGRPQDIGLQKTRNSIHLRNHMRLWLTQYQYHGVPIFLGQISRDIGVKLNKRTITTHAIDPDVDETRDGLVEDLAYSRHLGQAALVKGSQVSSLEDTHYNLTPDPYYSDGYRMVMVISHDPVPMDKIGFLDWEKDSHKDIFAPVSPQVR